MEYISKTVTLKNGRTCLIRRPEEADAERMIALLRGTAEETAFLGWEPWEVRYTLEQEREIIRRQNASERALLLLAEVDGVHAGSANFACVRDRARFRHRCTVGTVLYRSFWGMGIGTALLGEILASAKASGHERAELEVVSTNAPAIGLYKKLGFEVTGTTPRALKYQDGTYADFLFMVKYL